MARNYDDERIRKNVTDRLVDDTDLDASDIEVGVDDVRVWRVCSGVRASQTVFHESPCPITYSLLPSFIRNPQSEDLHFRLIVSMFLTLLTPEVRRAISSALDFSCGLSTSPVIVTS